MRDMQKYPGPLPDVAQQPFSRDVEPGRVWFRTDTLPKSIAKTLKRRARELGIDLKHSRAQEIVAKMYGYRNWIDLRRNLGVMSGHGLFGHSLFDEDEIAARQQMKLTSELNIAPAVGDKVFQAIEEITKRGMRPAPSD